MILLILFLDFPSLTIRDLCQFDVSLMIWCQLYGTKNSILQLSFETQSSYIYWIITEWLRQKVLAGVAFQVCRTDATIYIKFLNFDVV